MCDNLRARMGSSTADDERLAWEQSRVRSALAGDRSAFAELYRAFAPKLYELVLMPKLGDARAAEDALSDTFRALLEHLGELETGTQSLWPWLCRVAGNKAIDQHRKRARTRRALTSFEEQLGPWLGQLESDAGAQLDERMTRVELQRAVSAVLDGLNPRYRRAIELRFLEEHARERCAELMEVKLGTFDVLLLRALRSFRQAWELHSASMRGAP
jgi:RNA polymerase sigma-70 factor (ECF subfamily)